MRVGGEMVGSVTVGMRLGNGFKPEKRPNVGMRVGGSERGLTRDERQESRDLTRAC